jgi:hypothetical protein
MSSNENVFASIAVWTDRGTRCGRPRTSIADQSLPDDGTRPQEPCSSVLMQMRTSWQQFDSSPRSSGCINR